MMFGDNDNSGGGCGGQVLSTARCLVEGRGTRLQGQGKAETRVGGARVRRRRLRDMKWWEMAYVGGDDSLLEGYERGTRT